MRSYEGKKDIRNEASNHHFSILCNGQPRDVNPVPASQKLRKLFKHFLLIKLIAIT